MSQSAQCERQNLFAYNTSSSISTGIWVAVIDQQRIMNLTVASGVLWITGTAVASHFILQGMQA